MRHKLLLLTLVASIALTGVVGMQSASAHQLFKLFGDNPDAQGHVNDVLLVIGHTDEPSFGQKTGQHDGKHNVEILLTDDATDLDLSNAELLLDKYFFKNVREYNKADSVEDADFMSHDVPIKESFGDPGHYVHTQVVTDGIYGYRVHGTIDYFGIGELPVDVTVFCKAAGMDDPSKFEQTPNAIIFSEFGCPEDIDEVKFPRNGHHRFQFDDDREDD